MCLDLRKFQILSNQERELRAATGYKFHQSLSLAATRETAMESHLRQSLNLGQVKATGYGGGGCICQGNSYLVDGGKKIYVKESSSAKAKAMFTGEFESLLALEKTGCVRVPHPISVLDAPPGRPGAILVMEHLDLGSLGSKDRELGEAVARMHLHNVELGKKGSQDYVSKFGFPVPTCCGEIPQGNGWDDDWTRFYANKLQEQVDLTKDTEAEKLWEKLKKKIPDMFVGIDVRPSLVHGDLWSGNTGQAEGRAALFDPGAFYGHHEYDLGIAGLFSLSRGFFDAYHKVIPKEEGFDRRHRLYKLFHLLNHWNHFGGGYRGQSLSVMKGLVSD